jgi:hypothetical protein
VIPEIGVSYIYIYILGECPCVATDVTMELKTDALVLTVKYLPRAWITVLKAMPLASAQI